MRRASKGLLFLGGAFVLTIGIGALTRACSGDIADSWVYVAQLNDLEQGEVLHSEEAGAFVVAMGEGPIALSQRSPHLGEALIYCRSSGLFESPAHGEKFDRYGNYFGGPAPRNMDRVALRIDDNGFIYVDPDQVTRGAPRGSAEAGEPAGPFCIAD